MADKPKMATKYAGLYVHSWTKPKRGDPKPAKYRGVYRHKVTVTERAGDGTTTTREEWRTVSKVFDTPLLGEAHALHEEWKVEVSGDDGATGADRGEGVADYVDRFVANRSKAGTIEASTATGYRSTARYIREALAGVPLGELRADQVREWEAGLTEAGYSSSTVGKCHRLLKEALSQAVADGILRRHPMLGVKPPKRAQAHPNAMDKDGAPALLRKIDALPRETFATIGARIAVYTGMRRAEICGLQWKNVDIDAGTIWVRRSIGMGDGGPYTKDAKTDRVRDVPIPAALSSRLRAWRAAQAERCIAAGAEFPGEQYVIGTLDGFRNPDILTHAWSTLAAQFGIVGTEGRVPTFHDLRHTFATMAIAEGVDVKTVSSILGHANAAMTLNVYASADPKAKRGAATAVNRAMKRKPKKADVLPLRNGTTGE